MIVHLFEYGFRADIGVMAEEGVEVMGAEGVLE